jgi:predicted DNA-binding protein YlxM (UPF0122 family)
MKETIGSVEYASLLYDFYGELLDDTKREVMDLYHEDNLSLSEIAEEQGISRQAVHYTLKKAEDILERFEDKLGLVKKHLDGIRKKDEAEKAIAALKESGTIDEKGLAGLDAIEKALEYFAE